LASKTQSQTANALIFVVMIIMAVSSSAYACDPKRPYCQTRLESLSGMRYFHGYVNVRFNPNLEVGKRKLQIKSSQIESRIRAKIINAFSSSGLENRPNGKPILVEDKGLGSDVLHSFTMGISYTDTKNIVGEDVVFISIDLEIWEPALNFRGKMTNTRVSEYHAIGDIPFSGGADMVEYKMNELAEKTVLEFMAQHREAKQYCEESTCANLSPSLLER